MNKQVFLIGMGPGTPVMLTEQAKQALIQATSVYGTDRLCKLCAPLRPDVTAVPVGELAQRALEDPGSSVGLLLSGDVGFYSAARRLSAALSGRCDVICCCGINSLQYFFAKLGRSYESVKQLSLHGRSGSVLGAVSYHPAVFLLTGGKQKAQDICRTLSENGLAHLSVTVGENLSMDTERICTGTAEALSDQCFSDLAVMLIENPQPACPYLSVRDEEMIRGDVPMTKEEVRILAGAKLQVAPNHVVWDVGAGTGSVSIELARKAADGLVYAVEHHQKAWELICRNRQQLGSYNVIPVLGEAPDCLADLPTPDRVFIGGSSGSLPEILSLVLQRNPKVRMVLTAVTMETSALALEELKRLHCRYEIVTINVSKGKKVGAYHLMDAQNPVTIITAEKVDEIDEK